MTDFAVNPPQLPNPLASPEDWERQRQQFLQWQATISGGQTATPQGAAPTVTSTATPTVSGQPSGATGTSINPIWNIQLPNGTGMSFTGPIEQARAFAASQGGSVFGDTTSNKSGPSSGPPPPPPPPPPSPGGELTLGTWLSEMTKRTQATPNAVWDAPPPPQLSLMSPANPSGDYIQSETLDALGNKVPSFILTPQGQLKQSLYETMLGQFAAHSQLQAARGATPLTPPGREGFVQEFNPATGRFEEKPIPGFAESAAQRGLQAEIAVGRVGGRETLEAQQLRQRGVEAGQANAARQRELDLQGQQITAQIRQLDTQIAQAQTNADEARRQFDMTTARLQTEEGNRLSLQKRQLDLQVQELQQQGQLAREQLGQRESEFGRTLSEQQEGRMGAEWLRVGELTGSLDGQQTIASRELTQRGELQRAQQAQELAQFLLSNPFAMYFLKKFGGGAVPGGEGLAPAPGALDPGFAGAEQFLGPQFPILSPMATQKLSPTMRQIMTGIAGLRGLSPQDLEQQLIAAVPPSPTPTPRRRRRTA